MGRATRLSASSPAGVVKERGRHSKDAPGRVSGIYRGNQQSVSQPKLGERRKPAKNLGQLEVPGGGLVELQLSASEEVPVPLWRLSFE
jgi:hypothetical protein